MTPKQQQLLEYIREYIAEHGYAPTYDEMQAYIGAASRSEPHRIVSRLIEAGLLMHTAGKNRNLVLPMANLQSVPTAVLIAEVARRERQA